MQETWISSLIWEDSTCLRVTEGNRPRIFIGSTDAEAPIFQPPDAKSKLITKIPDAGKD